MSNMSIKNVLNGLDIDSAAFEREQRNKLPAEKSYVVVFTPRSGSSWLTSVLSATGKLGFPEEYINPEFLRNVARATNSVQPEGIISGLKRRRKTSNGVFGIEVLSTHVSLFGEKPFFQSFDLRTPFFNLWRDNLVAQGISLYRAVSTRRFHSSDGAAELAEPIYNASEIEHWINHTLAIENENIIMLKRQQIFPRFLRYEDIVKSRQTTIALIADAIRVDLDEEDRAGPEGAELKKIGDVWNIETEASFRRERAQFVGSLDSRRLIKLAE